MTATRLLRPQTLQEIAAFRQWLHRHPETGFTVGGTATAVAQRLRSAGLSVTEAVGGSGVVATLAGRPGGRAIGLRADMDALPITEAGDPAWRSSTDGRFHGCGHDGHTAMLLGAACHLAEHRDFAGTVHFIFQPDEENGNGARAMIEDGLFERFPMDAVYGLHNLPGLPLGAFATRVGPMTAFEELFEIRIDGRGGHASAPDRARDPLVAGAEMVLALQSIVARAVPPHEQAVVSITELVTDGARNIIPSTVTLRGDTRGYTDAVSRTIRERMDGIARGVAQAHGVEATLDYRREFEPTVNTESGVEAAAAAVGGINGATIDTDCARFSFSEDFAQFLRHRSGCFIVMGNGTEGPHAASLHNPHYDFNDAALPVGIAYWVELAARALAG